MTKDESNSQYPTVSPPQVSTECLPVASVPKVPSASTAHLLFDANCVGLLLSCSVANCPHPPNPLQTQELKLIIFSIDKFSSSFKA